MPLGASAGTRKLPPTQAAESARPSSRAAAGVSRGRAAGSAEMEVMAGLHVDYAYDSDYLTHSQYAAASGNASIWGHDDRDRPPPAAETRNERGSQPLLSGGPDARHHRRPLGGADPARPHPRGAAAVPGPAALARAHQPEHALGPAQDAGGARHRRAPALRAPSAARRIPPHRQGRRAAPGAARAAAMGRETHQRPAGGGAEGIAPFLNT